MPSRSAPSPAVLAVAASLLALCAVPAAASAGPYAELDRATFVKRADKICGPAFRRAQPLLDKGVAHLRREQWEQAADYLLPGYRILRKAYRRVGRLDRPPEDLERIRRWLDLRLRSLAVGVDAIHAYGEERLTPARRLTERSIRLGRKAARVVQGWGFRRCR